MTIDSQSTGPQITNKPQDRNLKKKKHPYTNPHTKMLFLYEGGMHEYMYHSLACFKKK